MPRGGKRAGGTPEKEVEEAASRIKKYPEHLRSARDSEVWTEFLTSIGVRTAESSPDFWDKVRDKIYITETGFSERTLQEQRVEVMSGIYRDTKGRFTKSVTDKPVITFRSTETGRFVSSKKLEKY